MPRLLSSSSPCLARVMVCLLAMLVLASPAFARQVKDSAGRSVEIPDAPARVFAAGPPASTLLYVLAPQTMTGWVRAPSVDEKPFLLPATRDLPETGRLTGRGDTVNLERLLASKPDLILDFGSINDTYRSLADRVQAQTGVPYLLIDGRFEATPAALRLVGDILGQRERGEALAREAERIFAEVDATLALVPAQKRPLVYLARGTDGLESGARGSINTEVIERVGGVNVVAGLGERGGLVRVGAEQLLALAPDTIITLDPALPGQLAGKAPWSLLPAARDDRIFAAPRLPFGFIDAPPSINRLIGLTWLIHRLYPQEAAQVAKGDLKSQIEAFYRQFYQIELDGPLMDRLLAQGR